MHLVYRALEKEPVPSLLPHSLIPPSKRKKTPVFPGAVPVLPASPPPKDSLRSTPSHGSVNSLNSTGSLSPKHTIKQAQVQTCFLFSSFCFCVLFCISKLQGKKPLFFDFCFVGELFWKCVCCWVIWIEGMKWEWQDLEEWKKSKWILVRVIMR